ncbi:MAG: SDR family NAD(P)-dependent oxidoreductase [Clostridia bacterium]|nr:SDR family NAD(P)-dependent oxidoreductase [Clostridia bacterium]
MKSVLVTGASGGMGVAICQSLVAKGYKVYGLDYRKGDEIAGVDFFECDVTNRESIEAIYESIKEKTDKLAGIVHTAGIYDMDSLIEMDEKRFTRIFDINVFGVFRINQIFAPMLTKGSRIIITSSELAPLDPLPFTGIYGITKATIEKYAFSLRMETNLLNIPVSIIRPGAVKTGLLGASTQAIDRFVSNTKLYKSTSTRFKKIVDSVESRNITPDKIADKVLAALEDKNPKYVYKINRNPLLLLLNSLPDRLQVDIIGMILKD